MPVDLGRRAFPISSSEVREDPAGNWRHIPSVVRPWYQKRVVVFGAESVGKSSLADRLAALDDGPVVAEVLRTGYAWNGRVFRPAMVKARG